MSRGDTSGHRGRGAEVKFVLVPLGTLNVRPSSVVMNTSSSSSNWRNPFSTGKIRTLRSDTSICFLCDILIHIFFVEWFQGKITLEPEIPKSNHVPRLLDINMNTPITYLCIATAAFGRVDGGTSGPEILQSNN